MSLVQMYLAFLVVCFSGHAGSTVVLPMNLASSTDCSYNGTKHTETFSKIAGHVQLNQSTVKLLASPGYLHETRPVASIEDEEGVS